MAAATAGGANPLFSLGLIADVQYVDEADGASFDGSQLRFYRASLCGAARAARAFTAARCGAALQLGDAIDGKNAKHGTAASLAALQTVLGALRGGAGADAGGGASSGASSGAGAGAGAGASAGAGADRPLFSVLGNHELLCCARSEVVPRLAPPAALGAALPPEAASAARLYYSFSPCRGWRVVVLDAYDVAFHRHGADARSPLHEEAVRLLKAENSGNPCAWGEGEGNFFAGLAGLQKRFVPFNGALSAAQLAWLGATLRAAAAAGEGVVVAVHTPLFPDARVSGAPSADDIKTCLLFNFAEVQALLAASGVVAGVFSGHFHTGGFGVDGAGVAHVTLESPLTHPAREEGGGGGDMAHAILHFFEDRAELEGFGAVASRTLRRQPAGAQA